MTVVDAMPWEIAAQAFEPRPRRWATPGELAQALDPRMIQTPALELIDQALVDLTDGIDSRIAIFMSPQEGKSERCSHYYPLWVLTENPDTRVAVVSHSQDLAYNWGWLLRQDISTFDGEHHEIDLGLRLHERPAQGHWRIRDHHGGVYCTGVSGSLSGRPVDCLRGGTPVLTEYGYARIEDLHHRRTNAVRVASFNHRTGLVEWRRIVASRAIPDRPLVEVITASGRRITCTPDHRIYSADRGYVPAAELRPGERLVAADTGSGEVPPLRRADNPSAVVHRASEAGHATLMLQDVRLRGLHGRAHMRGMRDHLQQAPVRGREGEATRLHPYVLHQGVLPGHPDGAGRRAGSQAGWTDGVLGSRRRAASNRDRPAPVLPTGCAGADRRGEPSPGMRGVRQGPQVEGSDLPRLLQHGTCFDSSNPHLRAVWDGIRARAGGAREARPQRAHRHLLHLQVLRGVPEDRRQALSALRQANRFKRPQAVLLLTGVPAGRQPSRQGPSLPAVRQAVLPEEFAHGLLRPGLRGLGTFRTHGGRRQLALQGRHQLRQVVPGDAPADPGAGREHVPCLRAAGSDGSHGTQRPLPAQVLAGGPSHQRAACGQSAGEPDRDLPAVPYDPPQVGYDTVSVVRELRGARDVVYDLQVEGNRNFFAGEVLVHNCLILDDPIKDLEQANSIRYRERAWRFWQAVAIPRMGPHTKVVLMTTRWHEDDIAGRILAAEGDKAKGGKWRVISIPARCDDEKTDPLRRKHGEYQISARGRTQEQWREREKDSGAYVWSALFQQRPSPAEGGVFKRIWWRYWTRAGENRIDLGGRLADLRDAWKFGTVDLAASTSTSADYTVIAAWARTLSGDLVLLDRMRAKIGEEKHFEHARGLVEQWQLDTLFVEKSQQGYTLVKEATQAGVPISPLTAEQDKLTRALPASAWCSGGRIWLPAKAWWLDEWRSEAAGFPAAAHDDQVDVLAYAVRVAITQWVPLVNRAQQATVQRTEPDPDPFGGQQVEDWENRAF